MENLDQWQEKIQHIAKMLPAEKLREALDFMEFLYQKDKGFSYTMIENSAEYVRELREQAFAQNGQEKDGQAFIKELIEWQESSS